MLHCMLQCAFTHYTFWYDANALQHIDHNFQCTCVYLPVIPDDCQSGATNNYRGLSAQLGV